MSLLLGLVSFFVLRFLCIFGLVLSITAMTAGMEIKNRGGKVLAGAIIAIIGLMFSLVSMVYFI